MASWISCGVFMTNGPYLATGSRSGRAATSSALPAVGGAANVYGVRDLHGLVWEWVDDFNALMVDSDSRSGDDPDKLKFCGAGAINLQDRQNYAVLMRIALLSSLQARDSTTSRSSGP